MKLSIITVNLNDRKGLEKTIQSIISQTFSNYEYIVIDGGSTDGSVDIIKQYNDKIKYWVSEPDKGVYNAMNKGILQAQGEYCFFLNSGDTLYSESVLAEIFHAHPSEDIIIGNIVKQHATKMEVEKGKAYLRAKEGKSLTLLDFVSGNIPHQATFISRELFDRYGLYDEQYKIVSDWLFFIKTIVFEKVSTKYMDLPVACFDIQGISNTNMDLHWKERRQILEKLLPPAILDDYDYFAKIDGDFRRMFRNKLSYAMGRSINKCVTLYDIIRGKNADA